MATKLASMLLGLLWLGVAHPHDQPRDDGPRERDARASLFRADAQLSRAMGWGGSVDGLVKNAASDVTYLHPTAEIIVGRGNAQEYLKNAYAAYLPGVRTELHRVAGDVSADGTLGYTFGWLDEIRTKKLDGVVETAYGRYVAVWTRRERDWQVEVFLRLGGAAPLDPPPAGALIVDGEPGVKQRDNADAVALGASIADARFADLSLAQGYTVAFDHYAADAGDRDHRGRHLLESRRRQRGLRRLVAGSVTALASVARRRGRVRRSRLDRRPRRFHFGYWRSGETWAE